ncbi:methionyl-tRNA formyltransferase [Patescibacteria group bacterium]|nr:methionyl-tRNA formyltransferase [Patescibacteria group bacterium]
MKIENCKLKIIFFGSSKYSTIVASSLHRKIGLTAVVTLPDAPIGRHKTITPNPVKIFAQNNNIPFITADKLDHLTIKKISQFQPDFLVIADYGRILPKELLALPKYAPINIHHSLLPKYRGSSPASSAILAGEKTSGVTIIEMGQKVDAGDILAQKEYILKNNETKESLLTALNTIGSEIIIPVLHEYIQGKIKKIPQDHAKATHTQKTKKTDGFIDINNPPSLEHLDRMIRAYYPWPTTWTKLELSPNIWKIVKLLPENKIQVEGGKPMTIKDFLNGYPQLKEKLKKLLTNIT